MNSIYARANSLFANGSCRRLNQVLGDTFQKLVEQLFIRG